MASNKKKKSNHGGVTAKSFSPEQYIRTRVRVLPIDRCYIGKQCWDIGTATVVVMRRHPQGTFTIGMYLVDLYCRGVYDAFYRFSVEADEMEEILDSFLNRTESPLEPVSYAEAHNIIYGANAFAEEAGIEPCKEWNLVRYILEEDTDDIELIDYEFGKNGRHILMVGTRLEASRYIPTLDEHLGKGNYEVYINEVHQNADEDFEDFGDGIASDLSPLNREERTKLLQGLMEAGNDLSKMMALLYDPDKLTHSQALAFYMTLKSFATLCRSELKCEEHIFDSYIELLDCKFTSTGALVANAKLEQNRLFNAINQFSAYSIKHADDENVVHTRFIIDFYLNAYRALYKQVHEKSDEEIEEIMSNKNNKAEKWMKEVMELTELNLAEFDKLGKMLDNIKR